MRGRIAWMVRRREHRLNLGVELEGTSRPIGVFRFPAGDGGIIERDEGQHERKRSAWRVVGEAIFQRLLAQQIVPVLVRPQSADGCFPEKRFVVGLRSARKALDLS